MLVRKLKAVIHWKKYQRKWVKRNSHNGTLPLIEFDMDRVVIGKYTYGGIKVLIHGEESKLFIGSYCSIATDVVFVLNSEHPLDYISTFPFKAKCFKTGEQEALTKGDIVVEDDVWIGQGAIILSGVHISQGAVIAAGAVVASDIEPYSIVGGIPAKTIRKRFNDKIIKELLTIDYSRLTKENIECHQEFFYKKIVSETQIQEIDWMPRKK